MRNDLFLITYGSIVSFAWFLAYLFIDYAWDIVYLDGVVHLICGAVVALIVIKVPQLKPTQAFLVVAIVLVIWEIFEGAQHTSHGDWWIMDTLSDIMLGAIGGVIIIFDGFDFRNKNEGDR